jgi:hypothetical protein
MSLFQSIARPLHRSAVCFGIWCALLGGLVIGMPDAVANVFGCDAAWKIVQKGQNDGQLLGVTALSSTDAWAVGYGSTGPLVERWNGRRWTEVDVPNPGARQGGFSAVSADSPTDVWAVGTASKPGYPSRTLTERWDGQAWHVVRSPSVGADSNILAGVTAISPMDVWAVGWHLVNVDDARALVLHWNGLRWRVVHVSNIPQPSWNELDGVAAIAPDDVWATGYDYGQTDSGAVARHWNGKRYHDVPMAPAGEFTQPSAIDAASSDDVWVVGLFDEGGAAKTLAEHWDGTSWSVVDTPNTDGYSFLNAVEMRTSNDVWAVGYFMANWDRTLAEHWDGSAWTIVPTPNPGSRDNVLAGVAGAPDTGQVWAVGSYVGLHHAGSLIELYCTA